MESELVWSCACDLGGGVTTLTNIKIMGFHVTFKTMKRNVKFKPISFI